MGRKEVARPAVVHNTTFSVVIKGFKPLDNGRANTVINTFCMKGNSNVKGFLKVNEV